MFSSLVCSFIAVLFPWTATNCLSLEEAKKSEFHPNYVAIMEVALSTPNGNPAGSLKAGTPVTGRSVVADVLNVTTSDGTTGLADATAFSRLRSSIEVTPACRSVARSGNQFAIDLYHQARQKPGNLFVSPASIHTALAMTWAGAAGETKREMSKTLYLAADQDVHDGVSGLMQLLNSTGDRNGYQISAANRIWGANNARFDESFLLLIKQQYQAPLEHLDFSQPDAARETVNAWVSERTQDRITNLIPPGVLKSTDRMVLTNAIYFLGGWRSEFTKSSTKPMPFHLSNTESIEIPTMYQQSSFDYAEDAKTQIVSLPYRQNTLAMVICLPRQRDGLSQLEQNLTLEQLEAWLGGLRDRPVKLTLPKFRLQSQLQLATELRMLGMVTAFSDSADFSGMSKHEPLKISDVIHQANIDVDEKGTEAAAATAVIVATPSAPLREDEPPKPVVFRADHPFLFLIRDNETGAILFLGRVHQPTTIDVPTTK